MISIVICTYNRCDDLAHTLAALATTHVPAHLPAELIIVDNASTDNTKEVVCKCGLSTMLVRYIYESRQGQCYARNTGIAAAKGEIILFTDDDVRPPQNWIAGMCEPILFGQADAVAGGVRLAPHLLRPWMSIWHRSWLASTEGFNGDKPERLVGANMAFSRKVLNKVPAFDTNLGPGALGFADETLFSMQIQQAGYKLASALDVCVEHHCAPERLDRASFLNAARKFGQSDAYVAHHWLHISIPAPRRGMVRSLARLIYYYARYGYQRFGPTSIADWEMILIKDIYFYKYIILEKKHPCLYEKYGLIKKFAKEIIV